MDLLGNQLRSRKHVFSNNFLFLTTPVEPQDAGKGYMRINNGLMTRQENHVSSIGGWQFIVVNILIMSIDINRSIILFFQNIVQNYTCNSRFIFSIKNYVQCFLSAKKSKIIIYISQAISLLSYIFNNQIGETAMTDEGFISVKHINLNLFIHCWCWPTTGSEC